MSTSDLKYFAPDQSFRVLVEVRAIDGTWVDLNSLAPAGFPDYYAGLLALPRITVAADQQDGVYSATIGTITMDNAPWEGGKAGFWDQPFPVTIVRDGVTRMFNSWQGSWVRFTIRTFDSYGAYSDFTIPPFVIESFPETKDGQATVRLASLFRQFQRRSGETLKIGTDWAKGWPIKSLIKMIAGRTNKEILFATGSDTGTVDLGMDAVQRASSWGSAPGILSTGDQSPRKWVAKCSCMAYDNPEKVWFGFACPGSNASDDSAIASFDLSTGQWTILPYTVATPSGYPVSISQDGSGYLWMFCVLDTAPTTYSFYGGKIYRIHPTTGAVTIPSLLASYWPGRETIRKGNVAGTYISSGVGGGTRAGESPMLPFDQVFDSLFHDMYPTDYELINFGVQLCGYVQGSPGDSVGSTLFAAPAKFQGCIVASALYVGFGTPEGGSFRYFMGTQMHAPYRITRVGGTFWFWIGTTAGKDFNLLRVTESTTPAAVTHPLVAILGNAGSQVWSSQVTAWAAAPNSLTSDTVDKVILAFIEWDEASASTVRWSKTSIVCAYFATTGGDALGSSVLVLDNPTDGVATDMARVCVSLWTPAAGTDPVSAQASTCLYSVAVLFNRSTLQRPCYGIGIVKCSSGVTLSAGMMFGSAGYTGPVSSMPFAGFARAYKDGGGNATTTSFYFTDQATGQAWRCDTATTTPAWVLLNKGIPIHATEYCHSTLYGVTTYIDSLYETVLWGLAPGVSADISGGYPLRSGVLSSSRHVPGIYPVVQLSRVISDAIEVADFSGMTAFDAMVALRQCAWDYRLFFTVLSHPGFADDKSPLINFKKLTAGTAVAKLVPLDMQPIPDMLLSTPEVGFAPGWSRKLLPVKNAVDVVPHGPMGAGEFTFASIKAAGSTWDTEYIVDVSTERPLRVAITCLVGGDIAAPTGRRLSTPSTAAMKPILWTWSKMKDTAHCWLASACTAASETIRVSGVTIKGNSVYAGDSVVVAGDWVSVSEGVQCRIQSFGTVTDAYAEIIVPAPGIGVAASQYTEVIIEPHDDRLGSISNGGVVKIASSFTVSATTMIVASSEDVVAGMVLWTRGYIWLVEKVVGTTLTVSSMYGAASPPDATLAAGTWLAACVYTKTPGQLYPVGKTGVLFGVAADSDDVPARTVSPGDGVIITAPGMRLGKLQAATIRKMDSGSIGNESTGTGYGRNDVSISDNRFVDLLRGDLLATKVLVDAWPRIEVSGVKIPAIWPTLTIGSEVTISDPRIVPPVAGVEQTVSFSVVGIVYDLAACTSELTLRSLTAATSGKRGTPVPSPGTGMPAGRSGEE